MPISCWRSTLSKAERRTCPKRSGISKSSKTRRHRRCGGCGSGPSSPMPPATRRAEARPLRRRGAIRLPADCPPIDRITWLRIITLQIRNEPDPARSSALVQALLEQVKQLTEARGLSPARVARLRSFLELHAARLDRAFGQGRRERSSRIRPPGRSDRGRPRGDLQARAFGRARTRPSDVLDLCRPSRGFAASATDASRSSIRPSNHPRLRAETRRTR